MTLLERERELEAIEGVLDRGGVLILEGGAGSGKTSLVNTACERGTAAGQEVLRGRGSELESGFEFGVVLQLFERRVAAAEHSEANELFAGPAAAGHGRRRRALGRRAVTSLARLPRSPSGRAAGGSDPRSASSGGSLRAAVAPRPPRTGGGRAARAPQ